MSLRMWFLGDEVINDPKFTKMASGTFRLDGFSLIQQGRLFFIEIPELEGEIPGRDIVTLCWQWSYIEVFDCIAKRTTGKYRLGMAEAELDQRDNKYRLRISSCHHGDLVSLRNQIRQGKISPGESWEEPQTP